MATNYTLTRSTSEIRMELDAQVKNHNKALSENDLVQVARLKKAIDENVKEYNAASEQEVMLEIFRENETPASRMIAACKKLEFPTLKVGEIDKETNPDLEITPASKKIDFTKYDKHRPGELGASSNWLSCVRKFNQLMTVKVAMELGLDAEKVCDSFYIDKVSREIDLGGTPTSNTAMLGALRTVIIAMIGEEYGKKVLSHDVVFVDRIFTREGKKKALQVQCANNTRMAQYLAKVCYRIIYDLMYDLGYDKFKEKKTVAKSAAPAAAAPTESTESAESAPVKKPRKSRKSGKSTTSEESREIEITTDAE